MAGTTLQERRILNDAIESAYIECAGLSAAIRTHRQTGRGAIINLFEEFHYNIGVLFDLTSDLEEMASEKEVVAKTSSWLDSIPPRDNELAKWCEDGRVVFRDYKKSLNNCGLIALPARGK